MYLKTTQGIFKAEIVRQADSSAPVDVHGLSTARVEYKWVNANGKKSNVKSGQKHCTKISSCVVSLSCHRWRLFQHRRRGKQRRFDMSVDCDKQHRHVISNIKNDVILSSAFLAAMPAQRSGSSSSSCTWACTTACKSCAGGHSDLVHPSIQTHLPTGLHFDLSSSSEAETGNDASGMFMTEEMLIGYEKTEWFELAGKGV